MCQVLGISFNRPKPFCRYWEAFRQRASANPDGWGIAYALGERRINLIKEPTRADTSPLAETLGRVELCASVVLAHVRAATKGDTSVVNTHPFYARAGGVDFALVHNGHLHRYPLHSAQYGQTDSEAFFLRFLEVLEDTEPDGVSNALLEAAEGAGRHGKLAVLLTDSVNLYAYTNIPKTLYFTQNRGTAVICTQPLPLHRGWQPLNDGAVYVFKNGKLVNIERKEVYNRCCALRPALSALF